MFLVQVRLVNTGMFIGLNLCIHLLNCLSCSVCHFHIFFFTFFRGGETEYCKKKRTEKRRTILTMGRIYVRVRKGGNSLVVPCLRGGEGEDGVVINEFERLMLNSVTL